MNLLNELARATVDAHRDQATKQEMNTLNSQLKHHELENVNRSIADLVEEYEQVKKWTSELYKKYEKALSDLPSGWKKVGEVLVGFMNLWSQLIK